MCACRNEKLDRLWFQTEALKSAQEWWQEILMRERSGLVIDCNGSGPKITEISQVHTPQWRGQSGLRGSTRIRSWRRIWQSHDFSRQFIWQTETQIFLSIGYGKRRQFTFFLCQPIPRLTIYA
jgi:hypothetical protein